MLRLVAGVMLLITLSACGAMVSAPVNERTYLPVIATPASYPLRGAALFAYDCEAVDLLGLDWYYIGPHKCASAEFVQYFANINWLGEATPYTMIFNEPEMGNWTVDLMAAWFAVKERQYPGIVWVGPCVAYDLDLIPQFWKAFERHAGRAMPPEQIRVCFHCYAEANQCMAQVNRAAQIAVNMGLPQRSIWLTEFGKPLGLNRTMAQRNADVQSLVSQLEAHPNVERYAYWPGLYWPLPDAPDPTTSYVPLLYVVYQPGGSGDHPAGYKLTAMGKVYGP